MASCLSNLPNLKNLTIATETNEDILSIFKFLPKLESLNGNEITSEDRENILGEEYVNQVERVQTTHYKPIAFASNTDISESDKVALNIAEANDMFNKINEISTIEDTAAIENKLMEMMKIPNGFEKSINVCLGRYLINQTQLKLIAKAIENNISPILTELCNQNIEITQKISNLIKENINTSIDETNYKDKLLAKDKEIKLKEQKIRELEEENKQYLQNIILGQSNMPKVNTEMSEISSPRSARMTNSLIITQSKSSNKQKCITKKQLKDIILDIYKHKDKYDQLCGNDHKPMETMEKYMYTYLNRQYGLKALVIEWASAIITSVKTYSSEDNDIAVFGKILKNECDENFVMVQLQVKNAIADIMVQQLQIKFPTKSEKSIHDMAKEIQKNKIEEWLWTKIITTMYNEENALSLSALIRDTITVENDETYKSNNGKGMSRTELNKMRLAKEDMVIPFNMLQNVYI